ncbi:MAG: hypothetical protein ACKOKF_05785 [Bacteroidota bacterium]
MDASRQPSAFHQSFTEKVDHVIDKVLMNAVKAGFKGHDPYDILKSPIPFRSLGTFAAAVATQLHKRNPVNLRPLLGIKKDVNPKAIGLLLDAVCGLQKIRPNHDYSDILKSLTDLAEQTVSRGYHGACWGYDFGWASPGKYLPPFAPSGVVTSFVVKGLFSHYQLTNDLRSAQLVESAADFVLNDLKQSTDETGTAISYTPFKQDICFNASLLAATVMARAFSISGKEKLKSLALDSVRYVVARQKEDGRWNYSIDPVSGREREQVDFHQGYVIDSLQSISELTGIWSEGTEVAVLNGLDFYRMKQFTLEGKSIWRYPKKHPVDIHNQAQGIITFSRAAKCFKDSVYKDFALRVAEWTITEMYDDAGGHFHYRKYPFFSNRIPYLRWADAWMLLALVELRNDNL